ncbi:glycerophosphoryl diester phosphodiesterase membrane domain-containing protein [Mucilaginibacter ginkgonis]|uniref:Glycerophosphoryl diester phosphodiesterase membrane domain-containing protein n=1 Tax=Mucilaginibacter ginkgonis TaxID=2682091 RepID=A0A6I4IMU6_9SPHI|nr:glycerophosphoryl diester phosphodiesterase membrane domain-containing protein [Mucilaginibacter ginkgonis]QQL51064.1 glycerophosphoryl diester phosphodiesterase membrane domain-containing protein [Mucilaginibacter ginkgonis]
MYHPFSIAETIKSAWNVFKKNYISLIIYSVLSVAIGTAVKFAVTLFFVSDNFYSQIIFGLLMLLFQSFLVLSFYKLILTLIDREFYEFSFSDILPSLRMVGNLVLIAIGYGFLIGTLSFINFRLADHDQIFYVLDKIEMVGIGYLLVRSIFCLCFIVDDDSGASESLKQSFRVTRGNFFKIVALIIIVIATVFLLLLIIAGIITLLVDEDSSMRSFAIYAAVICWFAISFPIVQVMIMVTYRKLVYSHLDVDDDVSETV